MLMSLLIVLLNKKLHHGTCGLCKGQDNQITQHLEARAGIQEQEHVLPALPR